MKKIPTLFERVYENHKVVGILPNITKGYEWVLNGEGEATIKWDGSCCAIIDGKRYKRYDAKKGKKAPARAIPCCDPDPITGHHPHWLEISEDNPTDKWFVAAFNHSVFLPDGTYEAVGLHFQGNPYDLLTDIVVPHGKNIVDIPRDFNGIKEYLSNEDIEGIVFWKDGEPQCKIKRSDFGFEWPLKEEE